MPELPEVETTRRGLEPLIVGQRLTGAVLRTARLRWPLDPALPEMIGGQRVLAVERRAKYLLLRLERGTLLLHLGMSGSLRVVDGEPPPGKHDHVDLSFEHGRLLRLTDPRKFGALLWVAGEPEAHPLLSRLGPEPLAEEFGADWLLQRARGRRMAVKPFIMDQQIVVGVGNIYASEALFRAGIRPDRAAGSISRGRWQRLVVAIKQVLAEAIEAGGTTLQDFARTDGRPGYFRQELKVYGREEQPCLICQRPIRNTRIGQRSTYFCPHCQR